MKISIDEETQATIAVMISLIVVAVCVALIVYALVKFTSQTDFAKRDAFIQECLNNKHYTRQECITLAGQQ